MGFVEIRFKSFSFQFQNRYKEKANFLFKIKMLLPNIIISLRSEKKGGSLKFEKKTVEKNPL